jgi:hypothetical protein
VGSSGWIACHSWSGTRVSAAVVVMAAGHAHSQGRQQDPDEGRKHDLRGGQDLASALTTHGTHHLHRRTLRLTVKRRGVAAHLLLLYAWLPAALALRISRQGARRRAQCR